eukprot:CFRG0870T1
MGVIKPNNSETVTVVHDNNSFYVIAERGETEKWRKDKSIAISNVVQSFNVLVRHGNASGEPNHPTKAELEAAFGSHNQDDAVEKILSTGKIANGTGMSSAESEFIKRH